VSGHNGGGKKTPNSNYEFGLLGFNWNQGFVTGFLSIPIETARTRLPDARGPILFSFYKVVVFVPNSLVTVSRGRASLDGLNC
jgi:hypothetical protein